MAAPLRSIDEAITKVGRQYAASALDSARHRFSRHDPIAASYRRRDAASQAKLLAQHAWAAGARVSAQEQRSRGRRLRKQHGWCEGRRVKRSCVVEEKEMCQVESESSQIDDT
jgi:hypothetical protein